MKRIFRMVARALTTLAVCAAWVLSGLTVAAEERPLNPINTWAILGNTQASESGLTDLLVSELSKTALDMVEREQLKAIVDEQTLQAVVGNLSAESRRLGKLLKADALVIVQQSGSQVKTILCDCRYGARIGNLEFSNDQVEDQGKTIATFVIDRANEYAGGIRAIIGLAPIACRNIDHDFDFLQRRLYDVLASWLMTEPGHAVLELREAATIASEFGAGDLAAARIVPILIEPSFRVQPKGEKDEISLFVKFTKDQVTELQSPALPIDQADNWLIDAVREVMPVGGQGKGVSLDIQQQMLASRAEYLMRLGDLAQAVECRMAFLLVDPKNVEQRTKLIIDLDELANESRSPGLGMDDRLKLRSLQATQLLSHLDFLIRNALVDRETAILLLKQMERHTQILHANATPFIFAAEETRAILQSQLNLNKRFLRETAGKILQLKRMESKVDRPNVSIDNEVRLLATWHECVMQYVAADIALNKGNMQSFRFFEQIVSEVVPEEAPLSWRAAQIIDVNQFQRRVRMSLGVGTLTEMVTVGPDPNELTRWLTGLKDSSSFHLKWYARLALMSGDRIENEQDKSLSQRSSLLDQYLAEYSQRPNLHVRQTNGVLVDAGIHRLLSVREGLKSKINPPSPPQNMGSVAPEDPTKFSGQIEVRRVPIKLTENEWIMGFGAVKPGMDIMVTRLHVALLSEGNQVTPIHTANVGRATVVVDGERLWVGDLEKGIFIYGLDGKERLLINQRHGLPGHDANLRLFAYGEKQIVVFGALKPDNRCWLALVTLTDDGPNVSVLHEARLPYRARPNIRDLSVPLENDDLDMVFDPKWLCRFDGEQSQKLLVGKSGNGFAVDIASRKIESFRILEPPAAHGSGTLLNTGDRMFKAYGTGVIEVGWSASKKTLETKRRIIDSVPVGSIPQWVDEEPQIVPLGDWIYKPGKSWYRFRLDGSDLQRLKLPDSPKFWEYGKIAASGNYGLVGWRPYQNGLYQIIPKADTDVRTD